MTTVKRKAETQAESASESEDEQKTVTPEDRLAQFRALKMRAKESKKQNRHSLYQESARMKEDPKETKRLQLQQALAEEKLAKLDALEAGEDFERKRAWDWSVEEAQAWDEKVKQKRENKAKAGFADYTQEASKQYDRNTKHFKADLEAYAKHKEELALAQGSTALTQYDDLNNLAFISNKPTQSQVDKLIADMSKNEAARLKASQRRNRGKEDDDVTYINNRNRVFNEKVSRFYDKYEHIKEMRDNFERGSAQ